MKPEVFDSIFRSVNREVWVVTSAHQQQSAGLLATWVSAASIDPTRPMIFMGLAATNHTAEVVRNSGVFGLHLLKPEQHDLAINFAVGSGRQRDKFDGLATSLGRSGVPLLKEAHSWMEGEVVHCFDGGDRWYFWGRLLDGESNSTVEPLREREFFAASSAEHLEKLEENREHHCEIHRPMFEAWLAKSQTGVQGKEQ